MTTSMKSFVAHRPLLSTLLAILLWFVLGGIGVAAAMTLLDRPMNDNVVQSVGMLVGIFGLLALAWRWGWLRQVGVTRLGGWRLWALTLALAVFVVLAYQFAFFGEFSLSLDQLQTEAGRTILWRQAVVGFVEETLFRGLLLVILVRAWGASRRGLFAAVGVTALLFGALHILQALGGSELWQAGLTMLNGVVSGLSLGALVLWGGSIWPAALLHALGNTVVQLPFVTGGVKNVSAPGYVLATLAELVLVVVCWWLLLRKWQRG